LRILDPLAFDADANGGDDELDSENLPELIVSGGGGAFLHPTHTFAKHISVNFGKRKNRPYVRTKAYPSKELSFGLSWLNVWQFRWRNWRLDVLFVVIYIGIVASLLPLCGVYSSYAAEAMHQGALAHLKWCVFFHVLFLFDVLRLYLWVCLTSRLPFYLSRPAPPFCVVSPGTRRRYCACAATRSVRRLYLWAPFSPSSSPFTRTATPPWRQCKCGYSDSNKINMGPVSQVRSKFTIGAPNISTFCCC